jgi:ubiquinone/menaquinone biosynthesis C-methylase UbiE
MSRKKHWEEVYASKDEERLGWYRPRLETSLAWIEELGLDADAPIIDVGGGVSTMIGDLLDAGHQSITVVDISEAALSSAAEKLGAKGKKVNWLEGDITSLKMPISHYDLWHDRAAFHFLTEPWQQRLYRDNLLKTLKPGGYLIIGVFAPEAPARCSGLQVQRYEHRALHTVLGEEFELLRHQKELHVTPGSVEQMYLYCLFRRKD